MRKTPKSSVSSIVFSLLLISLEKGIQKQKVRFLPYPRLVLLKMSKGKDKVY